MTAINVFLQRDRAWLVTDAAWYDRDGVVLNFAPKSQPIGHWPGAIATRGPGIANASMATEAGLMFADFDAFADEAASFLEAWCERNAEHLKKWADMRHIEVVAVGWSKRLKRPRALFVSSKDEQAEVEARGMVIDHETMHIARSFAVTEIDGGYVRPMPTEEAMQAYRVDPMADFETMESLSGYALKVVCAQRELREPLYPGAEPICFVGGYVMDTVVTEESVFMRKGVTFPDRVGERIYATRGDVLTVNQINPQPAAPPPNMTRQQRRAWEADQRKRGAGRLRSI